MILDGAMSLVPDLRVGDTHCVMGPGSVWRSSQVSKVCIAFKMARTGEPHCSLEGNELAVRVFR